MKAQITFKSLVQNSQDYSLFESDDSHIVSVIHFDMQIGDQLFRDQSAEVRQPYGTAFESEPLEVKMVSGDYHGPWNHVEFADLCENYYRSFIGSTGGIRIEGGARFVGKNNLFSRLQQAELNIPDGSGDAW